MRLGRLRSLHLVVMALVEGLQRGKNTCKHTNSHSIEQCNSGVALDMEINGRTPSLKRF